MFIKKNDRDTFVSIKKTEMPIYIGRFGVM